MIRKLFCLMFIFAIVGTSCSGNSNDTDVAKNAAVTHLTSSGSISVNGVEIVECSEPLFMSDSLSNKLEKSVKKAIFALVGVGLADPDAVDGAAESMISGLQDEINDMRKISESLDNRLIALAVYTDSTHSSAAPELMKKILVLDVANPDSVIREIKVTKGLKFGAAFDYYAKEGKLRDMKDNYEELSKTVSDPIYRFVLESDSATVERFK